MKSAEHLVIEILSLRSSHRLANLAHASLPLASISSHVRPLTRRAASSAYAMIVVWSGHVGLHIGLHKWFRSVAWIRVESQTILSIHTHVITRNYRITLDHKNRQNWNLAISNVEEADRGQYMCQINTVPMKKRIIYLEVLVYDYRCQLPFSWANSSAGEDMDVLPPKFIDRGENEVMAREGTNITLSCKVKGYPLPTVTWEREGGKKLSETKGHRPQGEDLSIVKVSRLHMGMYVCTATSSFYQAPNYQPVTRNVMLHVLFPPMIWIPHQLIFASVGETVSLDCYTEAFPMSINYWTKADSCNILQPGEKYSVSISDNVYQVSMKLIIADIQAEDFGSYKCIAKNSLGSTEGIIRLFGKSKNSYELK
ncbi:lachesin-like [Stegodyphus dumicola]|uniref:lachesin-like n=1 Tax=Stegodyphus dumicola TaxID=202533 RepID=UPI0015AE87AE|nr:lachesin-like [Stegodyphus dumicola]